ncbi:N-formylglutamate amidohydrolase [Candidatus Accumulibacter aalborgensis]|uniref:N-formylglutamate amidohydrolase n=1 Tax=Candidatus Accumulibacter aalborgensis TaxID=1860102 RepID=A0A1A8XYI0_9PROT|nr:N-formylglutamate amidohydrolase [Candidatus Accumulibacter aalborgensis]SBT09737.1 N-formylglutamate amidohydrolase [Candidatus Accumulibacter aalborgensis]
MSDGHVAERGDPASAGLVITCEHGGNRIPPLYHELFASCRELLDSHRGYDPGALIMARDLARAFAAPLVTSTVSRLLVDLNRSVGHPRLHSEASRQVPAEPRERILTRYYQPYRAQAERLVGQAIAEHGLAIHVSSHSFTPELDGKVRHADIGLLYDPGRPGEVLLCERWQASLRACGPGLTVRRNYPYAGKGDGLTASFRQRLPPSAYIGVELEVNQKHVASGGRHWRCMRRLIVESLRRALADPRHAQGCELAHNALDSPLA